MLKLLLLGIFKLSIHNCYTIEEAKE